MAFSLCSPLSTLHWLIAMTLVALFVSVTKLAGVLVTLTVAANAFSFARFRRKNLRPFRSPIHDTSDLLADFTDLTGNSLASRFPSLILIPQRTPIILEFYGSNAEKTSILVFYGVFRGKISAVYLYSEAYFSKYRLQFLGSRLTM